jgi:hypothetical protein
MAQRRSVLDTFDLLFTKQARQGQHESSLPQIDTRDRIAPSPQYALPSHLTRCLSSDPYHEGGLDDS